MHLELQSITKIFDSQPVLRDLSLTFSEGEILVLLGPSGCGKTTLLRIMAGLAAPDDGRLLLNNQDLTQIPVYKRNFGFVFQEYALFPHKNVSENVAFGLRMHNWKKAQIDERVAQVLDLVGLAGFGSRAIHELSGGEQQRVALARSLAPAPRLILLDEPLGALDRALRERLMLDLRHILKEASSQLGQAEGITAVYVTHDQAEAFAIADRVVVMNQGQIEQIDTPRTLYRQPSTPFVARFLGMENILEGVVTAVSPLQIRTEMGTFRLSGEAVIDEAVTILIRPEAARLLQDRELVENRIDGRLTDISFRGRYQIVTATLLNIHRTSLSDCPNKDVRATGENVLKFEFDTAVRLPAIGAIISLSLAAHGIHLLKRG
ncbi:MAG: ABC transporter ATP-binding protein [Chloroflexi bacterium]|nr:ABC transporter ATP-binding protein [Chloroflexota bacterium]